MDRGRRDARTAPSSIRNSPSSCGSVAEERRRDPGPRSQRSTPPSSGGCRLLPAGHPQGYAQCFENFVVDSYAAVDAHDGHGRGPDGLPTFADGARAAAICDAMLRSAASGEWVGVG